MDDISAIILRVLRQEFSDLADIGEVARVFIRLTVAVALGGLLGYDRERIGTPAGLRTHMLVALGSALFVLVPMQTGMPPGDITRVLQGIIAGIGFLGTGTILKLPEEGSVKGLTTAAGVWLTCAVGVAAGMGHEATAILSTLFALVILSALSRLTRGRKGEQHAEMKE